MINDKGKIYYGLGLDNAQLRADAAEARSVIKGIGDTTVSEGNRIDGSMRKIGVAVMGAFSVQQAAQFAKTVVDVRGEIEALEKSFVVLAGHKGIPLFNEIRAFATDTTFQLGDLAKGAQTLMAFNIEADRVMPILRQIGDISMGNVDKFNSLILAFAQMSSTGKLMGQDLLQMINAGFNPLTVISDKTGKSIAQLKKEMEQGGITSDMVADAFESATAAGGKFNGMLEDQSKGIKGLKSNLEGAWEEALNSIGEKNEEVIKGSIQGVTLLVQNYEKVGEVLAVIVGIYGTYKAALIATETARNAITTVRHTEEAASLYQLLTAEQQAMISKQGLSTTSAEYYALVKAESTANVQAAQATLAKARTEVSAASQTLTARRSEYVAAKQAEAQRAAELAQVKATGTTKQIEAAQRKLNAAQTQRESAAIAFQSASQDFHAKKTAVVTAAKQAEAVATATNTAAQTADATATGFLSVAKTRLTAVAARLNAVIMANPFALAAAAVVALGYGIYKLVTYQTDAEKAQEKLNDAVRESEQAINSERHQIDAMFARLKAAKEGTDEYRSAKEAIMSKYGEYLKGLGDETTALNDVAAAYTLITQEAKKAANARAMEAFTADAADTLAKKEGEVKDDVYEMLQEKFKGQKGADGIDLAETYYWKIKPVLEGEGEITDEIQGIIDQFEKTGWIPGSMFTPSTSYQYNPMQDLINSANQARGIFNNAMDEAQRKFGENPVAGDDDAAPAFDAMTASLSQLMEQLPKARQELAALKAEDKPDPAAIAAKQQEIQTIEAQTLARERQLSAIKDVKAQIEVLQKEQLNYAAGSDEYNALEGRIKALQKKLPKTGGGSEETEAQRIQRETAERNEQIQQYGEAVSREVRQAELDIAQSKIDAMEEGFAKQQAQIKLTYDRMIFENQQRQQEWVEALRDSKELEWQNANPNYKKEGKTFDRSTVTAADLTPEQKQRLQAYTDFAEAYQRDSNARLLTDTLGEFLTYEQKKHKIVEEYAKKREELYQHNEDGTRKKDAQGNDLLIDGATQGNIDLINQAETEDLYQLEVDAKKVSSAITALFQDMSRKTTADIKSIAEKGREALDFLTADTYDAELGLKLGISEEQYNYLKNTPTELEKIRKGIEDCDEAATKSENAFEKMASGIKKIVNAGDSLSELDKGIGMLQEGVNEVIGVLNFLEDTFSGLGDAFGSDVLSGIGEGVGVVTDALSSTMSGVQAGAMFGPWGAAIGGAIGLATSLAKSIAKIHDKKHEKEIARLGEQVNTLQKSYDLLGEAIEEAYSKDASELIEQKNELLEQQKVLIQQQIAEEEAKKKTDNARIEEWKQQIEDIDKQIADNKEAAVDAVFGSDLQNAIENFASAYADAWANGTKSSQTARDYVRNMMRDMVTESIKAAIASSKAIEEIRAKLLEFYADGVFDAAEQEWAYKKAEELQNDLDAQFGWADSLFENEATREGAKSGIATASQESVDELNGRATAIQSHTYTIAECQKLLVETTMQLLEAVWGIQRNTDRLEAIEGDMRSVKNTVNDIALKGIKLK